MEFIEVSRITEDKNKIQVIRPETICVADIKTFRPWHRGKTDTYKGDATIIVLRPVSEKPDQDPTVKKPNDNDECSCGSKKKYKQCCKETLPTILINESYHDFLNRMNGKVILKS